MRRMSIPSLILVATLALLMPLEQAHCAWMGLPRQGIPVAKASRSGHECCKSPLAAQKAGHAPVRTDRVGCVCEQLPAGTMPLVLSARTEAPSPAPMAVPTAAECIALVSIVTEAAPAPDVGSPPPPDDPGAHGLRAPPVSA